MGMENPEQRTLQGRCYGWAAIPHETGCHAAAHLPATSKMLRHGMFLLISVNIALGIIVNFNLMTDGDSQNAESAGERSRC